MKFLEKITGSKMTKEWKTLSKRAEELPLEYQLAWEEISATFWAHSGTTSQKIINILDSVLGLLEESVSEGLSIEEVLVEDVEGFCSVILREEGAKSYQDKWHEQLNHTIAKKLSK